jgi:hypothetical protein
LKTDAHSGLVSGITAVLAIGTITLLPGFMLGIAQRRAQRMPAETRSSYSERFLISRWLLGFAWMDSLLGVGIICLGIAHPHSIAVFCALGGAIAGLGAGCMIMFRRASLVITEREISYHFGREKWRVARTEIKSISLAHHFIPAIVVDTAAAHGRSIPLVFRNTGRILFLLRVA